ncbi:MAG TPA: c-type cytochrome, partial [Terriglobales bacterium]
MLRECGNCLLYIGLILSFSFAAPGLQAQNVRVHNAPQIALEVQNPYTGQTQAISAGKKIYTSNCGACHGIGGKGNGNIPPLANETIQKT